MTTYVDELINEWVYGISIDSQDRVWFGTEGGISMFDGEHWRHWTNEQGVGGPNSEQLPVRANTGLGTRERHDLSVYVDGQISYNPNYVFAVLVDPDDRVWVGTWGGGLSVYENGQWVNHTRADGLAGNIVYAIARSSDGALWLGTNRGMSLFRDGQWTTFDQSHGLFGNDVYAIEIGGDGRIWAGTRGGVVQLDVVDTPHSRESQE
jgi:ligand-binding sensor domain-containing protein